MRSASLALLLLAAACSSDKPPVLDMSSAAPPTDMAVAVDFAQRVDLLPIDYDAGLTEGPNIVPVYVDGHNGGFNVPFITITICVPGTSTCQTIDHVLVDTGSVGLRVPSDTLTDAMLAALPNPVVSGQSEAECYNYASGYVFGSVRNADVTIGAENAPAIALQITGDITPAPTTCAFRGDPSLNSKMDLGGNAIIGIAGLTPDCGLTCTQASTQGVPAYYGCTGSACAFVGVPTSQQLPNPVTAFSNDNNGYILSLPAISDVVGGVSPIGTLTFGINTQSNNMLTTETVYETAASAGLVAISALVDTAIIHQTVFDSGTSLLLIGAAGPPDCTGMFAGLYCPPTPTTVNLPLVDKNGLTGTFPLKFGNGEDLFTNTANDVTALDDIAEDIGAGQGEAILGLPSFFGHKMFFGINGHSAGTHKGPFYAF